MCLQNARWDRLAQNKRRDLVQLGDWFVLYQLCKNCNPYFFREFIKELARDLKRKPKETKKTSKDSSTGELVDR